MNRLFTTAVCGMILAGLPAIAQEVTGGALAFSHSALLDDSSLSKTGIDGQIVVGFGPSIAFQVDLGFNRLNFIDETTSNLTLHSIYNVTDQTSLGLFVGADRVAGESLDFVGFEVGQQAASFDIEAYVGYGEDAGISGTIGGVSGRYAVSDSFGVGGGLEHGDIGGLNVTRLSLKGDYAVAPKLALTAEIGTLDGSGFGASGSEAFVGLGGKFTFGDGRGATFGKRGLINLLPGL
ncbi:MAG: hypothetical protein V4712_11025 [Pseudomonadota bacterium]